MTADDPVPEEGWVERELALEYPELRLVSVSAPAPARRSPSALRERLRLRVPRPRLRAQRVDSAPTHPR